MARKMLDSRLYSTSGPECRADDHDIRISIRKNILRRMHENQQRFHKQQKRPSEKCPQPGIGFRPPATVRHMPAISPGANSEAVSTVNPAVLAHHKAKDPET